MGTHQPIRKTVTPEIPDKLYFRIGDVSKLCEVPAYVLRFWESEFPNLRPNKGGTGQRLYRRKDVETALRIKSLLYDQGYTIPGARQVFRNEARPGDEAANLPQMTAPVRGGKAAMAKAAAAEAALPEHRAQLDAQRASVAGQRAFLEEQGAFRGEQRAFPQEQRAGLEDLRRALSDLHAMLSAVPSGDTGGRAKLRVVERPKREAAAADRTPRLQAVPRPAETKPRDGTTRDGATRDGAHRDNAHRDGAHRESASREANTLVSLPLFGDREPF